MPTALRFMASVGRVTLLYFLTECLPVSTKCCRGWGQTDCKQTCQRWRSYAVRLAVASTIFQLRRYESEPLACCWLPQSATAVCILTRTSACGHTWSLLWEHVVQRYDSSTVFDGVCQIKLCWRSSEPSSSARSTTAAQCWSASLATSRTDFSQSSTLPPDLWSPWGALTHHAAPPRPPLVVCSRADTLPPLCFDAPLFERYSTAVPHGGHPSGSWRRRPLSPLQSDSIIGSGSGTVWFADYLLWVIFEFTCCHCVLQVTCCVQLCGRVRSSASASRRKWTMGSLSVMHSLLNWLTNISTLQNVVVDFCWTDFHAPSYRLRWYVLAVVAFAAVLPDLNFLGCTGFDFSNLSGFRIAILARAEAWLCCMWQR